MLALRKKLIEVRPVTVGDTFRRLAAKTGCEAITAKAKSFFGNLQLGCCTLSGPEAAAHATRVFCYMATEQEVLVKLGFANAFNAIRRAKNAESINRETPELLPFFKLCYSEDSILSFGRFSLPSSEGWQQGDPLAGFVRYFNLLCLITIYRCHSITNLSIYLSIYLSKWNNLES